MLEETPTSPVTATGVQSMWGATKQICLAVVVMSVLACVGIAIQNSSGLTQVKVTAIDPTAEPRDHKIPFFKQKDALPDYELIVYLNDGGRQKLGTKPNQSAAEGLQWAVSDPVSVTEISGIGLFDHDKVISDAITEVQITDDVVLAGNYKFEFTTQHSISVGVRAFFRTPIGKAISAAFFIAFLLLLLAVMA